jgi:hypothetical protein
MLLSGANWQELQRDERSFSLSPPQFSSGELDAAGAKPLAATGSLTRQQPMEKW